MPVDRDSCPADGWPGGTGLPSLLVGDSSWIGAHPSRDAACGRPPIWPSMNETSSHVPVEFLYNPQSHPAAGGGLLCVCLDRARCDSGPRPGGLHADPAEARSGKPRDRGVVADCALGAYRCPRGRGLSSLAMDFLACPDRFPLWRVAPSSLRIAARRNDAGQRPYLVRGAAGCDRSRPVSDRHCHGRGLSESRCLGRVLILWRRQVAWSSAHRATIVARRCGARQLHVVDLDARHLERRDDEALPGVRLARLEWLDGIL